LNRARISLSFQLNKSFKNICIGKEGKNPLFGLLQPRKNKTKTHETVVLNHKATAMGRGKQLMFFPLSFSQ
jgi:hypothetical protein